MHRIFKAQLNEIKLNLKLDFESDQITQVLSAYYDKLNEDNKTEANDTEQMKAV